jgi:DNA-binding transcriptional LysR family regulator
LTPTDHRIYKTKGTVGKSELGYSESDDEAEIRWDDFRLFMAIAKTSSIKRAAASVGTTQSTLSKRLVRLEQALGVRLIDRGPLGASLTYQGERVFARVRAAERELSRATADATVAESRVEGDCSILTSDGIANYWLANFISAFFERFPNIELRVVLDHEMGGARNQVYDIRLHYYEPIDPAKVMRSLATVHFLPFATRKYLGKYGTPTSLRDLAEHRLADQSQYLVGKGSWSPWFGDEFLTRTALFTNQSAFLAKCISADAGVALMPSYMVTADPELVPLNLGVKFPAKLFASYHRERVAMEPVKATLGFLRNSVFDTKTMPWFTDDFAFPEPGWLGILEDIKNRLRDAD